MKITTFILSFIILTFSTTVQARTIPVSTTTDDYTINGNCTLREAVSSANSDTAVDACRAGSGMDTITLPAGTYTLSLAPGSYDDNTTGDLDITDALTIKGASAATTIIDANGIDRVMQYFDSSFDDALVLHSLTITGGNTDDGGGGIRLSYAASLTVINSTVSGNTAAGDGGGIDASNGSASPKLKIINSTVSGNTTAGDGGGIYAAKGTSPGSEVIKLTVINSTVSGNTAVGDGGGIDASEVELYNTTIANNTALAAGGGVHVHNSFDTTGKLSLNNTIIADNTADSSPDCAGKIYLKYSIIGDTTGCTISSGTAITGDPDLKGLGNYGGNTQTHKLKSTSIAIDAGDPSGCVDADGVLLTKDQTGSPRRVNYTGAAKAICDIGAFEKQEQTPLQKPIPGLKEPIVY